MFVPIWRAIPLAVQLVVPVAVPLPPRLFVHVTWVTPTLSDAVPPSVREALPVAKVGLEVGVVMVTVCVVVLPAASRAVIVSTFDPVWRAIPLAVQLVVPVAVPLPPRLFAHVTCVTPTLSDALPRNARRGLLVLKVAPKVGEVIATVGGMVSFKVTVKLAIVPLPAASCAVTVSTFVPG